MKMSEAYDRIKKLERMIAEIDEATATLKRPILNTVVSSVGYGTALEALAERRDELVKAVTELGNMNVVEPPTPPAVATPEDYARVPPPSQMQAPAPNEKYGWTGLQLVGEMCLFSNDGKTWLHGPFRCVGYFEERSPPYQASFSGFWSYAKWYDGIE